ncbi:MAG: hypothetical protein R3E01_20095 [Pirellulaceae bacterium]
MQLHSGHDHLEIPDGMRERLEHFRQRVWIVKIAEGLLAALFGLVLSYLFVFVLDRLWDTPTIVRVACLLGGMLGLAVWFPMKMHRWVWRTQKLEQVARLLRFSFPRLSDQMLGIIELAHSDFEQGRSHELCQAAMRQVDEQSQGHDFSHAVPHPRHKQWALAAGFPLCLALLALLLVPAAGGNALVRWLMPWAHTERYTFAQLEKLPDKVYVPYSERFDFEATLKEDTEWSPETAKIRYGRQRPIETERAGEKYEFELPPQKEADKLTVKVGDARKQVAVEPTSRPELKSVAAEIVLPAYLQYSHNLQRDVRGGVLSVVKGSNVKIRAEATRELTAASFNDKSISVDGSTLQVPGWNVTDNTEFHLRWRDNLTLTEKQPFRVSVVAMDDRAPTVLCDKLARVQILLEDEVLSFDMMAEDDFGVRQVGLEWEGIEDPVKNPHPALGETVIAAGGPEMANLNCRASFSAKSQGVAPQTLIVRMYVEDYLPGRQRVYTPEYVLHVLSPEEHAIWLTSQMRKWFRQAQEVYRQEQQLHETNKELRALPTDQLASPENRRRIETQAAAEQANGRRLGALTMAGEELVKQAARNDQFNVATLEGWSDMLVSLKDIANNRMPSVADLLKNASTAPATPSDKPPTAGSPADSQKPSAPQVGNNRDQKTGGGPPPEDDGKPKPPIPSISDVESSFNDVPEKKDGDAPPPKSGAGKLTLPVTTVMGGGKPQEGGQCSAQQEEMDEAIAQQEDLLAEFAKVAEELQKILDNLEGSTFVKRLKAASRRQQEIANDVNKSVNQSFGVSLKDINEESKLASTKVDEREKAQSDDVYIIQEDLQAFFNRVQDGKFQTVLNEMKEMRVVTHLRDIGGQVVDNMQGRAIAHAEFWSDHLDRWAEQLVGPGCPGGT